MRLENTVNENEAFMSKKEVAKMLGISVFTIDKWVSERKNIPFIKLGTRVIFKLSDVESFLAENRYEPIGAECGC